MTESKNYDVSSIASSEARILLLYSTQAEANVILRNAASAGLNTSSYLWIVTQSVVGNPREKLGKIATNFQIGMLGIHFEATLDSILKDMMPLAVKVFAFGAHNFLNQSKANKLTYDLSCDANTTSWPDGEKFFRLVFLILSKVLIICFRFLLNVTIDKQRVFNQDGTARKSNLKIVNLRPTANPTNTESASWEEVKYYFQDQSSFTIYLR